MSKAPIAFFAYKRPEHTMRLSMMATLRSLYRSIKFKLTDIWLKRLAKRSPLKVIVGAGGTFQTGWVSTDIEHLNILDPENWGRYFAEGSIDAILAEHVWEHLTGEESLLAARNCFKYLKHHGYLRVAVPDGFHPSREYIEDVKPGGRGAGADCHKILYNYKTLSRVFTAADFDVDLIEWFDEKGQGRLQGRLSFRSGLQSP